MMQHLVNATTHAKKATVSQWCRVLGVSRSGLYAARQRRLHPKSVCAFSVQAKAAFEASGQSYGSRRLSAALKVQGLAVGCQRARTLMRSNGLRARWRRKFMHTPQTAVTRCPWQPMCWRASSIPKRPIEPGLATIASRQPLPGLVVHSDRGSQYASQDHTALLARHGLVCSMSRKGNCWDNAVMERFFLNLKMERVWQRDYANHGEAQVDIADYIVGFYNATRLHSTLGYRSPAQYEHQFLANH